MLNYTCSRGPAAARNWVVSITRTTGRPPNGQQGLISNTKKRIIVVTPTPRGQTLLPSVRMCGNGDVGADDTQDQADDPWHGRRSEPTGTRPGFGCWPGGLTRCLTRRQKCRNRLFQLLVQINFYGFLMYPLALFLSVIYFVVVLAAAGKPWNYHTMFDTIVTPAIGAETEA